MSADLKKCHLTSSENIITPAGRLHYPNLWTPRTRKGKKDPMYDCSFFIPPEADISLMEEAVASAISAKWGAKSRGVKEPFLYVEDFDEGKYPDFDDEWCFIRCGSKFKPDIIDAKNREVDNPEEIYAGRWARLIIHPFPYDNEGKRGISFGLDHVQLLRHDEELKSFGGERAADAFKPIEVEEDDGKGEKRRRKPRSAEEMM